MPLAVQTRLAMQTIGFSSSSTSSSDSQEERRQRISSRVGGGVERYDRRADAHWVSSRQGKEL
jgi:frataxin-like iron-binding protein CyaY